MEFLYSALKASALVIVTLFFVRIENHYMRKRNLKVNPMANYLIVTLMTGLLFCLGGMSLWTIKGIAMALILLYASVQDITAHEADDFLWVMLLILALVDVGRISIGSMVFGCLIVFVPQMMIVLFSQRGGIGGADMKISTAAALSLGFWGSAIGYCIGLAFAVVFQLIYNKRQQRDNRYREPFALLPYLSAGLMIGYLI